MENVEYGLVTRGVEKLQRRHRAETALAMMNLGGLGERYPGELSGGQQQRVAVARAVVVEPDVLLLDEPLSNLDARLRADMRVELKALARRLGVTTIYVTHDQREALSMADRVAVMKDGRVVQCAPPRQLYAKPRNEFVATFVGDANVFDGSVASAREGAVAVNVGERTFKAARSAEFAEGEPVRLLFRPEDVETGEDLEGENTFEARVTDVSFAGDREEVVLTDPKGRVVRAIRAPGAKPLELGEQTFARFPAASAHVFRVE
jgi:ABC-type Fe3+/spermidine/putrescine transport system ATPase subunit